MRLDIATEVIGDEVVIAVVGDGTYKSREGACVTEHVGMDGIKHFEKIGVESVGAVMVFMAEVLDVFRKVSEEEDVIFANFAGNFNLLDC